VARLSRRHQLPVWMTAGTEAVHKGGAVAAWHCFNGHQNFSIGELGIEPFPVPHDAREPCQFVFSDGEKRLGLLTDVGSITSHIVQALLNLDAIILECNHDPDMLACGPYPPVLKQRVGGSFGHLSNQQAADLLARIDTDHLQHLVIAHLSEKNNHPELPRALLSEVLGCHAEDILVADQPDGLSWMSLN